MIKNKRGFLTLLGLLFTLAIICFLCYKIFNFYFKSSSINTNSGQSLSGQFIDTATPQTMVDTTRKKIEDINKQHINELDNIQKQLTQ